MRAAWYERPGPPEEVLVVGEMPRPTPGPGEVLVAVARSGINPHDTKRRSGWLGLPMRAARIIPHSDGAGRIMAVGEGVDAGRTGERVWFFRADAARPGQGSAAECVVVPAEHAVPLPPGVSFDVGACLGVPAVTAHVAVHADGPVAGQTILVQGGAGAVAGYAIQFARLGGAARVLATVSSNEKAEYARMLGADATIDYRREDVADAALSLTDGSGVDRIVEVDLGANVQADARIIREHGVIASYSSTRVREPVLPYYPLAHKGVTLRLVQGMILTRAQRQAAADELTDLLRCGALRHPPLHRFPLERIAEAHAAVEGGELIGKVLLTIGD
jgi:NADPH:quinone reductase-like Zn-dependent oxidoreductase